MLITHQLRVESSSLSIINFHLLLHLHQYTGLKLNAPEWAELGTALGAGAFKNLKSLFLSGDYFNGLWFYESYVSVLSKITLLLSRKLLLSR
jgi:hypothetical protein